MRQLLEIFAKEPASGLAAFHAVLVMHGTLKHGGVAGVDLPGLWPG
jgi:hypothetical protein